MNLTSTTIVILLSVLQASRFGRDPPKKPDYLADFEGPESDALRDQLTEDQKLAPGSIWSSIWAEQDADQGAHIGAGWDAQDGDIAPNPDFADAFGTADDTNTYDFAADFAGPEADALSAQLEEDLKMDIAGTIWDRSDAANEPQTYDFAADFYGPEVDALRAQLEEDQQMDITGTIWDRASDSEDEVVNLDVKNK